ncbi:unnamed protein product [Caenorhabditis sp. 36 PRJEB53466]|nr:unnamed protein product [Caenorhabditis sp. 36 PRJEB53466]
MNNLLFSACLVSAFIATVSAMQCYWGVSGYTGRPLWKRECGEEHCIKITDEKGVETRNCDLTSYCPKSGCASNHLGGKTCCCNSQLCNSSSRPFNCVIASLVSVLFNLLNR